MSPLPYFKNSVIALFELEAVKMAIDVFASFLCL